MMRINWLTFALCMLVSLSTAAAEPAASYIGRILAPDRGMVEGYTVEDGYAFEATREGNRELWLLTKIVSMDAKGRPTHQVIAATFAPKLPEGYVYIRGMCVTGNPNDISESRGQGGSKFIAAVKYDRNKPQFTGADIHSVWYLDIPTRTIQPRSVAGITCGNESYHLR